jgi:hypothetical protein
MIRLIAAPIVVGVLAAAAPAYAAPPDPKPKPTPVTFSFTIFANAATGSCGFDVLVEGSGKTKTIKLPSGGTIVIAPNTKVTATNTETGKSVTYSINGAFHNDAPDALGNVVTKATGRNFLTDPIAGVVVTSGNFSFTTAPNGSNVVPLSGKGKIINVCTALA